MCGSFLINERGVTYLLLGINYKIKAIINLRCLTHSGHTGGTQKLFCFLTFLTSFKTEDTSW